MSTGHQCMESLDNRMQTEEQWAINAAVIQTLFEGIGSMGEKQLQNTESICDSPYNYTRANINSCSFSAGD